MTTNHPAHGPVSLERLHQISEILSKAAAQSDGGNLGYAMADAVKVIDEVLEASNAETVVLDEDPRDAFERSFKMPKQVTRCGTGYAVTEYSAWLAHDFIRMWEGWKACRAAMLQGAETVSNSDELPLDYRQGHKDGLEWAAQLAEANHPQTGDWLYDDPTELARAIRKGPDMPTVQAGNSPVTPDTWIPVSDRMPEDDDFVYIWPRPDFGIELHVAQYGKFDKRDKGWYAQVYEQNYGIEYHPITVTHWLPLPAAPQEVK